MNQILTGDCIEIMNTLPEGIVQSCITSPPYWGLRDYGEPGQYGLEKTPEEYVAKMVDVFRAVRRVLRDDGTLWLNLGDSYAGGGRGAYCNDGSKQATSEGSLSAKIKEDAYRNPPGLKPKDLCMIPARVALALQADGWYLRSDIIWAKPNPMPESVTDRPTKSYEHVFLLSKKAKYYYDADAVREPLSTPIHKPGNNLHPDKISGPNNRGGHSQWEDTKEREWGNPLGRNLRDVWTIATQPCKFAHFATFPDELVNKCILAGTKESDVVLDPFGGTGTVAFRAQQMGRQFIHIDISEKYNAYARERTKQRVMV